MMYGLNNFSGMMGNFLENCGGNWLFFGGLLVAFWFVFQFLFGVGVLVLIWLWIKKLLKEVK